MEGEQYLAINPDTLSDTTQWSYRDIQKLCMRLQLGGRGSRDVLEERLIGWHRRRKHSKTVLNRVEHPEEVTLQMNVVGNNFSILRMNVAEKENRRRRSNGRRNSLVPENGADVIVSPTILKPLRMNPDREAAIVGILKGCREEPRAQTPKRLDHITFSPFNGVKVIPHRTSFNFGHISFDDEDCSEGL